MVHGGDPLRKEFDDVTYLESQPEIGQMFRDVDATDMFKNYRGITKELLKLLQGLLMEPRLQLG